MWHSDSGPLAPTGDPAQKLESTPSHLGGAGGPCGEFDGFALYRAMDAKRQQQQLTWRQAAQAIWDQSATLNLRRQDHPISPSTVTGLGQRGNCTCQHALFFLRWLGLPPENFLTNGPKIGPEMNLPQVGPELRLRWDLAALYSALNDQRCQQHLTWGELARKLRCTPSQLTVIKTIRFAIGMKLAMRIVQWLGRPASSFIYAAKW